MKKNSKKKLKAKKLSLRDPSLEKMYLLFWCSQDKNLESNYKKFSSILKLAINNDVFKNRLLANSDKVLKEFGIKLKKGLRIQVVDNNSDTIYLMIPRITALGTTKLKVELKDRDLASSTSEGKIFQDDFSDGNRGLGTRDNSDGDRSKDRFHP